MVSRSRRCGPRPRAVVLAGIAFLASVSPGLAAADLPRIAVLPLNPISVSKADADVLSTLMETALVKTQSYEVIEQRQVAQILDAQERSVADCTDEACAVEFGRLLAAEQILLGTFSALGGKYYLNAKLIDVASGKNVKADVVDFDSLDKARDAVELLAFKLAGMTYTAGEKLEIARTFGDLFVETDPDGADIYVNGAKRGVSPDMISRVPVGKVRVEARKGAYYGEQTADVGATMVKVKIPLKESYGALFIKANQKDVLVYVDGARLGPLGSGLFEAVTVGAHALELRGDGLLWQGEAEIKEGESVKVEATLRPYGEIAYTLPEGVTAEVTGTMYRKVVRGNGTETPVWEGVYKVSFAGEGYVPSSREIRVTRKAQVKLEPALERTPEYERAGYERRLVASRAKVAAGPERGDVEELSKLDAEVRASRFGTSELGTQVAGLLRDARLAALTREVSRVGSDLGASAAPDAAGRKRLETLSGEAEALGKPAEDVAARIGAILRRAEESGQDETRVLSIASLGLERDRLAEQLHAAEARRRGITVAGWVSVGVGVAVGGLSALFWYLSDRAYASYQATSVSADAIRYRADVGRWNTLTYVSWGVGGGGIGVGITLLVAAPSVAKQKAALDQIEAEIKSFGGGVK